MSGLIHPILKTGVRATIVVLPTVANGPSYTLGSKMQFQAPYKICGFSHRLPDAARKTEANQALVAAAVMKVSFLHLKKNGTDEFLVIPLENVQNDITGFRDIYWISPDVFDFQNSNIVVGDVTTITAGACFELVVYTTDPNATC